MSNAQSSPTYKPFMSDSEFSQLKAAIWSVRPRTMLEWGSGGSTQTLLRECPFIERYHSIEHDRPWFERIRDAVTDPRLTIHLVEPVTPEPPRLFLNITKRKRLAYRAIGERDPALFKDYIEFPRTLGIQFDFVLVDGRARTFCLETGWDVLRPGGVMALHDSQRKIYHPVLARLGEPLFLKPWSNGQISLIRKPDEAETARKAAE